MDISAPRFAGGVKGMLIGAAHLIPRDSRRSRSRMSDARTILGAGRRRVLDESALPFQIAVANSHSKCNTPHDGCGDLGYARLRFSARRTEALLPYNQITADERYALGLMRKQGYSQAEMARALHRHPSTISRELRRNVWRCNGRGYVPSRSQSYTIERRRRLPRNSLFSPAEWALVELMLREDDSPTQVVGWCARFEILTISHETIHRHI